MSEIDDLKNKINDLKAQINAESESSLDEFVKEKMNFCGHQIDEILGRDSNGYYAWISLVNGKLSFKYLTPEELQMNQSFIDFNKIGEKY